MSSYYYKYSRCNTFLAVSEYLVTTMDIAANTFLSVSEYSVTTMNMVAVTHFVHGREFFPLRDPITATG